MSRALLAAPLLLAACAPPPSAPAEERRQVLEGLELRQSELGRHAWTLKSRLAVLREDEKKAVLMDPVMEFYRGGKAVSRVTARSGEAATDTHDVRLSSLVTLDSFEDRSRLTTDELTYDSSRKRFVTDREVLVQRPGGVLRGKGLEATPDLSEIRVHDQRTEVTGRKR